MSINNYVLSIGDRLLHDHGMEQDNFAADALAASGDCFVTLATQLDELTHHHVSTAQHPVLEDMVRTLLYLQRHYAVVKKPSNYRQ